MVDLMNKDLGLAFGVAQESNSNVPMGKQAAALFRSHAEAGNGRSDFSSIFQYYNKD
jgi:3-hydroxyisobutyrate dehydrogenase